jgi:hypothetical protein
MTNDLKRLADIVVDWTGTDIDNLLRSSPGTDQATQEFIRCLTWTLAQDPEARRLLGRLLEDEFRS